MISFDYPLGLLLFVLIPFLYTILRAKTTPKRDYFTPFFLLKLMKRFSKRRLFRIFYLKRKHRIALSFLMISAMILAFSGLKIQSRGHLSEKWMLVLDNVPTTRGTYQDESILDYLKRGLRTLVNQLPKGEELIVVTTSPVLAIQDNKIDSLKAADSFTLLPKKVDEVQSLASLCDRIVVFSPRSDQWKALLVSSPCIDKYIFPEVISHFQGNVGIVRSRIKTLSEEPGKYNIYLVIEENGSQIEEVPLIIENNGKTLEDIPPIKLDDGSGNLLIEALSLFPGLVRISLSVEDAFDPDNHAEVMIEEEKPLRIAIEGSRKDIYGAVINAHPLFTVAEKEFEVIIYLGDPPLLLETPSLVIFPSSNLPGLEFREIIEAGEEVHWHPDHPVTAHKQFRNIHFGRANSFFHSDVYQTLATAGDVPIILAGEQNGNKVIIWTFNPLEKGLFLRPEFVILLRTSIEWLAGSGSIETLSVLSSELTREAANITIPDVKNISFEKRKTGDIVFDPVPFLLLSSLLIGLFLSIAGTVPSEE